MRLISPKEYAKLKGLCFSTVYRKMKEGKVPWVDSSLTVKRIPWDDTKMEAVKNN